MTQWRYRLFLMIPATAFNAQLRAIAGRFSANGSGETEDSEYAGLANVKTINGTDIDPPTVYALSTPAKAAIKDRLRDYVAITPQARIAILSTDPAAGAPEGVLLYTNVEALQNRVGTPFAWSEAASMTVGARIPPFIGTEDGSVLMAAEGIALAYGY